MKFRDYRGHFLGLLLTIGVSTILGAPSMALANGPKPPPVGSGDMDIEPPASPLEGSSDMLIHEHYDELPPAVVPEIFGHAAKISSSWSRWLETLLAAMPSF